MKIRVTGTKAECEQAKRYYESYSQNNEVVGTCTVSNFYPNRNSKNQYRVYIDITCNGGEFGQVKPTAIVPR